MKIFIYDSLKRGCNNSAHLRHANYLGECWSEQGFTLYNQDEYVVVEPHGDTRVFGEVYAVDRSVLDGLDFFYGYGYFYKRKLIKTELGMAWIYYVEDSMSIDVIEDGIWQPTMNFAV